MCDCSSPIRLCAYLLVQMLLSQCCPWHCVVPRPLLLGLLILSDLTFSSPLRLSVFTCASWCSWHVALSIAPLPCILHPSTLTQPLQEVCCGRLFRRNHHGRFCVTSTTLKKYGWLLYSVCPCSLSSITCAVKSTAAACARVDAKWARRARRTGKGVGQEVCERSRGKGEVRRGTGT